MFEYYGALEALELAAATGADKILRQLSWLQASSATASILALPMDPASAVRISGSKEPLTVGSHRPVVSGQRTRVRGHSLRLVSLIVLTVAVWVGPSAAQVPTETADSAVALFNQGLRAYRLGSRQSLE